MEGPADAKELVRWLPLEAEIEPRVRGRYWMSWGGEYVGEHRIEIFEPERRLRTTWPSMTSQDGKPAELAVDYHLEAREGRTALRLVHSGFGRGLLLVSFIDRGGRIRIISARRATRRERRNHEESQ